MKYVKERSLFLFKAVDEVLLEYIERLEKTEGSGLYHGRSVALAVKQMIAILEDDVKRNKDDTLD